MPLAPPPEHIYETREEAEEAIKTFAWQEGYSTKKLRTKSDKYRKTRKVWLACAHGGGHRSKGTKIRETSTRLLMCSWAVTIQRQRNQNAGQEWRVTVVVATHNHEANVHLAAIPEARAFHQKLSFSDIIAKLQEHHSGLPPHRQRLLEQDLNNLVFMSSTSINESALVAPRGRPKGSKTIKRDPSAYEYIERTGQGPRKRRCGVCDQEGHNKRTCRQT